MTRCWRRPPPSPSAEVLEARTLLSATPWPGTSWSPPVAAVSETVLVRFLDGLPAGVAESAIGALGAQVARAFPDGPLQLSLRRGLPASDAARWLENTGVVCYAEADGTIQATATLPNDPRFVGEWGLNQSNDVDINAPEAWSLTTGSSSTIVAVTDTGIDYTHPDLYLNIAVNQGEIPAAIRAALVDTNSDGRLDFYDLNSLDAQRNLVRNASGAPVNAWAATDRNGNGYIDAGDLLADPSWINGKDNDGDGYANDLIGWNFVANTNNPFDDNVHGTHVSGTIAATSDNGVGVAGVDWNARILPVKILDSSGSGSNSTAISGINYAAKLHAAVINASWGGGSSSTTMANAIADSGAVFVAAAGNNGSNNDSSAFYPASYRTANEIAVASVGSSGSLSSFSDYGAKTVDLAAPGESISSTVPGGYASGSGTSMATPHVSGVVALLSGLRPELNPSQLVQQVVTNVKPLASLAGKTISGGMVDAYRVLTASLPSAPSAPTNLAATAASSGSIQLTWTGSANASSYQIQRSPDGSANWTVVATTDAATTSFLDTGLTAGTTYYYQVIASNAGGDSPPSNVAGATTDSTTAPAAPTNLTAAASKGGKISLSWNASAGATSYQVERSLDGTTWARIGTVTGGTSYVDSGLASSTTYYYRVAASNDGGDSPFSNIAIATTLKKGK